MSEQSKQGEKCVICQANFRPEAMVGAKCKTCEGLYPDAQTLEDIKDPNKERARLLNEPVIRQIIYEILAEAGIKRKRCEDCKKLFFPRSPAAKFCDKCRPKVDSAKPKAKAKVEKIKPVVVDEESK